MSTPKAPQFQTVVTLPAWHPARFRQHIPHRYRNHCGQRQHTAHQRNHNSTWTYCHQHTPPTLGTWTTASNSLQHGTYTHIPRRVTPFLLPHAGCVMPAARVDAVPAVPTVPAVPAAVLGARCDAPPSPSPHASTARHPTPQHDTNTPPPPHGRSGQDITGVAVEEEGGGFPMCLSAASEMFRQWTRVAQVTVGQVCRSPLDWWITVGFCNCV